MVKPERDPNVFRHEPLGKWGMMYGDGQYHVLTSTNLLDWTDEKKPLGNSFECLDFFGLPIDNDRANTKWVLVRADGKYTLGTFDGTQFNEETLQYVSNTGMCRRCSRRVPVGRVMLTAQGSDRLPGFLLLEEADDLLLGETVT